MESSKKKSKNVSHQKAGLRSVYTKQKFRTEPSPKNQMSGNQREKIRSTLKKFNSSSTGKKKPEHLAFQFKEQGSGNRIKAKNEGTGPGISNIRTSLTPKNYHHKQNSSSIPKYEFSANQEKQANYLQAYSTKNRDNDRFLSTGRVEMKKYFQKRKQSSSHNQNYNPYNSKTKETEKGYSHSREPKKRLSPRTNHQRCQSQVRDDESTTIKVGHAAHDELDVRVYLTAEEYEKFGDRFPEKFKRIALLGRGGFSVVWLGVHRSSKKKVAIKQILTKNPHETHLKQIWFGSYFFEKGGDPRQEFEDHIGINNICRLYYHQIKTVDTWLFYEVCEDSLGSSLFDLKGETVNGQRTYKMSFKPFIHEIRADVSELKRLVVEVSKALFLMNSHNIVHSDLKTENILIKVRGPSEKGQPYIKSVKLIDFGSSFLFTNLKQFSMATPQYMPPEILNYILYQNKLQYSSERLLKMDKYINAWVVDVWSLGCIILQIVSGLPLWMSIPTKIETGSQRVTGLFAVKGRIFNKIIEKQINVVSNLRENIKTKNFSKIQLDDDFIDILQRMLSLEPEQRISPMQILKYFGVPCQPQRIPFY